jgi:gas vesicle protein
MSSTKKDNIKESTNPFKETTDRYLEQQRQQYKDTASNLSQITEKINQNINKFQEDNRRILENNADTFRNLKNRSTKQYKKHQITL